MTAASWVCRAGWAVLAAGLLAIGADAWARLPSRSAASLAAPVGVASGADVDLVSRPAPAAVETVLEREKSDAAPPKQSDVPPPFRLFLTRSR